MKILIDLGGEHFRWLHHSRMLALVIKPILEALVMVDQLFLRKFHVPPLYQAGVRYQREPDDGIEEFASTPKVLVRGYGDCDDLAPWRVAELRNQGERAKIRVQWRKMPNGKLYHIVVRRGNGTIEDPSRILGM